MSRVTKFILPAAFALIGTIWFAFGIARTFIAPLIFLGVAFCLGVVTLLAAPSLSKYARSCKENDNSPVGLIWFTALWFILFAGFGLSDPLTNWQISTAKSFAMKVRPQLEQQFATTGKYPTTLTEVAYWDIRRGLLSYQSDGRSFWFTIDDPREIFKSYVYTSTEGKWITLYD